MLPGGINTIIWDWNGTLLDDLDICITGINKFLKERDLPFVTKKRYREIFCFPIEDYYKKLGFDFEKERFDKLSDLFLERYFYLFSQTRLYNKARIVLESFNKKGCNQYLLSAMDQNSLEKSVAVFGLTSCFKKIAGASDILASGKISTGMKLMKEEDLNPQKTILIGDTLHDKEVADVLKIPAVLVSAGHQNANRLKINQNTVVANLSELYFLFTGNKLP